MQYKMLFNKCEMVEAFVEFVTQILIVTLDESILSKHIIDEVVLVEDSVEVMP